MLLEVHQPIGQLEVVDVEHLAAALERGRIFAVRVDHHDVTLGRRAREMRWRISATEVDLPVPVEPSTAKCLREHRVDVERAADVVGRIDGADLDVRLVARGEDRAQILGRHRKHFGARDRIAGDAAAEVAELAGRIAWCLRRGSRRGRRSRRLSPARSVRTLAISQLLPTIILTWLPTWPDMATDGSACD